MLHLEQGSLGLPVEEAGPSTDPKPQARTRQGPGIHSFIYFDQLLQDHPLQRGECLKELTFVWKTRSSDFSNMCKISNIQTEKTRG